MSDDPRRHTPIPTLSDAELDAPTDKPNHPQECTESTATTSTPTTPATQGRKQRAQHIPPQDQQPQGPRLRSGTVLPGPSTQVRLEYLENSLLEDARESNRLTDLFQEVLASRGSLTAEQRIAQLLDFQKETERFQTRWEGLEGFSRSLDLEDSLVKKSESVSISSIDATDDSRPVKDLRSQTLEKSLTDTGREESHKSFDKPKPTDSNMAVDYAKVAKLTAQLVPLFSGENSRSLSQELQTFLGCCKQTQQCLSPEEQAAFLQILPTRLRGEAYQLFASDVPATFKEVEDRLNRAFLPRETYQELVNKLITTRQLPLEPLNTFTSRLKQLLALCKEAADSKYGSTASPAVKTQLEDFAKNALRSGVTNLHLCQHLLTLGDLTMEELIQKALDMERLQQSAQFFQVPPAQIPLPATSMDNSTQIRAALRTPYQSRPHNHPQVPFEAPGPNTSSWQPPHYAQPQRYSAPRQPQPRYHDRRQNTDSRAMTNITCSFCNRRGHTYADCLKRKNTPFCTSCKRYDHDVRDCPRNRPPPGPNPQNRAQERPSQDQRNTTGRRVFNIRLKCDFCGRRGHAVESCQQKQKWESNRQGNDQQSAQNSPARL